MDGNPWLVQRARTLPCTRAHMRAITSAVLALLCSFAALSPATAATITFATEPGSDASGQPVSAQVTFVTSDGQISVLLENLFVDPTSVSQNVSGLWFTLATPNPLGPGTLTSDTGMHRKIDADGTFTDLGVLDTDWTFSGLLGQFFLDGLAAGPDFTLVGGAGNNNLYDSANGSIAGNRPHNPFLANSALFIIAMSGVTSETLVSASLFRFGTNPNGGAITATCLDCGSTSEPDLSLPEPGSLLLLGSGLIALGRWRGRTRGPA